MEFVAASVDASRCDDWKNHYFEEKENYEYEFLNRFK